MAACFAVQWNLMQTVGVQFPQKATEDKHCPHLLVPRDPKKIAGRYLCHPYFEIRKHSPEALFQHGEKDWMKRKKKYHTNTNTNVPSFVKNKMYGAEYNPSGG